MAGELGWDQAKRDHEIKDLMAAYPLGLSGQMKVEMAI
jgi:hypothetical protein